jgi:hypothetical protein
MNQDSPDGGLRAGPEPTPTEAAGRVSRRRLLRAGASATPVLMTLVSGPVSATTSGCMVASSFVSVATFKSRNPTSTVNCSTYNCEHWQDRSGGSSHHQGSHCGNNPLDDKVCSNSWMGSPSGCSSYHNYSNLMLCDVMGQTIVTSGQTGVLQHLVAMTLNCTQGGMPAPNGISQTYLKNVWSSYCATRTFAVPGAGVVWNEGQIITWLRSMMGYTIL